MARLRLLLFVVKLIPLFENSYVNEKLCAVDPLKYACAAARDSSRDETIMKILMLQGANMTWLGQREPERYGTTTAAALDAMMAEYAKGRDVALEIFYTNVEGEAIDRIYQATRDGFDGLLMNPAGFQYAGFALRDCLAAVKPNLPCVEVHITHNSITGGLRTVTAEMCAGMVLGFGIDSYMMGLDGLVRIIERRAR
jgi:3-dehydroquinate dehydratase II